jgi:hypothetical protein
MPRFTLILNEGTTNDGHNGGLSMPHSILFPQYALAVWTLVAPLVVGLAEWFITRRERSELTRPRGRPGYVASPR